MKTDKQVLKLFLLGILAMFLLNFPLISLAGKPTLLWGIPRLYVYVFGVWAILWILVFILVKDRSFRRKGGKRE
jgi:hypothetical protein